MRPLKIFDALRLEFAGYKERRLKLGPATFGVDAGFDRPVPMIRDSVFRAAIALSTTHTGDDTAEFRCEARKRAQRLIAATLYGEVSEEVFLILDGMWAEGLGADSVPVIRAERLLRLLRGEAAPEVGE